MKSLRIKLFLSIIIFAVILVSVMSYVNRHMLITNIKAQEEKNRGMIENDILTDMQTVDNAHYYFDASVSNEMEQNLREMVNTYNKNPDMSTWNLDEMKKTYGMDIFILDTNNTVIYTTFEKDLGLSFSECCSKFSKLLDKRRQSGQFYSDGIDVSTKTGQIKKYSYLATPDKKYLLEIGVDLNNVPVFQTFNFVNTANRLVNQYDDLIEVKIINSGGVFIDNNANNELTVKEYPEQYRKAFYKANKTMKPVEYTEKFANGVKETYRFIPYEAENVRGDSTKRIVFIKYNNDSELALLKKNAQQFWMLLFMSLVISMIILWVILQILTKTIKLATYDALTGVYNRATYIMEMEKLLEKSKTRRPGLLLVDLDNFKQVNDQFGHTEGDCVLVETAKILQTVVKDEGVVARLGGDEFAIIINDATPTKLQEMGNAILESIHLFRKHHAENERNAWQLLSVSIGGAVHGKNDEAEVSIFERADKALYHSKNNGKDQFSI